MRAWTRSRRAAVGCTASCNVDVDVDVDVKTLSVRLGAARANRIRPEQLEEYGVLLDAAQRGLHARIRRIAFEVDVKQVLPRRLRARARLELRQVQVVIGQHAQTAHERATLVARREDQRRLT